MSVQNLSKQHSVLGRFYLFPRLVAGVVCSLGITFSVDAIIPAFAANFVRIPLDSIAGERQSSLTIPELGLNFGSQAAVDVSVAELEHFAQTGEPGDDLQTVFGFLNGVKAGADLANQSAFLLLLAPSSVRTKVNDFTSLAALIPDNSAGRIQEELNEPINIRTYEEIQNLPDAESRERQNLLLDAFVGLDKSAAEKREALDILALANGIKLIDFLKEFPEDTITRSNLLPTTLAWLGGSAPEAPAAPEPPVAINPEPPAVTPEPPIVEPEPPVATPEPPAVTPEPPVTPPEPPVAINPKPPSVITPGETDSKEVPEPSVLIGVMAIGAVGALTRER